MGIPFNSSIDLNGHEIVNLIIHNSEYAPTVAEGAAYFNTLNKTFFGYNGTSWISLSSLNLTNGDLAGSSEVPTVVHVTESSKTLEYTNGLLTKITDSIGTKTFTYTDGILTNIVGTGKYQSKNITYANGVVSNIEVINNP